MAMPRIRIVVYHRPSPSCHRAYHFTEGTHRIPPAEMCFMTWNKLQTHMWHPLSRYHFYRPSDISTHPQQVLPSKWRVSTWCCAVTPTRHRHHRRDTTHIRHQRTHNTPTRHRHHRRVTTHIRHQRTHNTPTRHRHHRRVTTHIRHQRTHNTPTRHRHYRRVTTHIQHQRTHNDTRHRVQPAHRHCSWHLTRSDGRTDKRVIFASSPSLPVSLFA